MNCIDKVRCTLESGEFYNVTLFSSVAARQRILCIKHRVTLYVHNMCYIFRDAANAGERPRLYNFLLQLPITVHSVNCYNGHPGASWFASSQKSESSLDCINVKPVHRITSSLGELDARSLMLGVSGSSQAKTGSIKTQNLMHEN